MAAFRNIIYDSTRYPVTKLEFNIKNCFFNKQTESIIIYDNHEIKISKADDSKISNITKLNG